MRNPYGTTVNKKKIQKKTTHTHTHTQKVQHFLTLNLTGKW